jgi:hypothetical protein
MADTQLSEGCATRHEGSSPSLATDERAAHEVSGHAQDRSLRARLFKKFRGRLTARRRALNPSMLVRLQPPEFVHIPGVWRRHAALRRRRLCRFDSCRGYWSREMPFKKIEKKRAYQRKWARKQRKGHAVYNEKRKKLNRDHARRWAEWFASIKQGLSCIQCGESHPACIDFHHRDRKTKRFDVARAAHAQVSKRKILAEIERCDPVCANCHRKLHWHEQNGSAKEVEERGQFPPESL